jgi:hypothetical protein
MENLTSLVQCLFKCSLQKQAKSFIYYYHTRLERLADKHSSLFGIFVLWRRRKRFYWFDTCGGLLHKYFTHVNYSTSKIRRTIYLHESLHECVLKMH